MAEKSRAGLYLLIGVILVYIALAFIKIDAVISSLKFAGSLTLNIIPIFILIFVLMVLTDYLLSAKKLAEKFTGKKGIRKWAIAVAGGILSSGPIYMWYPLLAQLKEKGVDNGFLACFIYNRAIKIPLLPLMIAYFGLYYIVVLSVVMIFMSVFQGLLIQRLVDK
jgi:uncharacterized membrane protein YraQ (UPF0718 family)